MNDREKAATDEELAIDSISNYVYGLRHVLHALEDLRKMGKSGDISVSMGLGEFADRDGHRYQLQVRVTGKQDSFVDRQEVQVA